jgi:putative transposase
VSDTAKDVVHLLDSLMQFVEGSIYHIYNRGNNKQLIFFKEDNYAYFRQKMLKYIYPNADILAWCLMPNHFHVLIHANQNTCKLVKHAPIEINALTEGIRLLLSSYTKEYKNKKT